MASVRNSDNGMSNTPLLTKLTTDRPSPRKSSQKWESYQRLAGKMLALVTLSQALDRSLAAEPITGSATDGHLAVEWTYDLDAATAELIIENIDAVNDGYPFAFGGLIPDGATNLKCHGIPSELQDCQNCSLSSTPCPDQVLFRYVPPGNSVDITFDLPAASWDKSLGESSFTYAPGYLYSAAACFLLTSSNVEHFVTVKPITEICARGDLDGDGDVDLRDYAQFQNEFTGPQE